MRESAPQRLAMQYARIIDDKAFDDLETIFTPDAIVAAPAFESNGMTEFRGQLEFLLTFSGTMHMIGNQIGEWDGDSYKGETYCVASHIYELDGVERKMEMGIRYDDEINLVEGEYKYTRRYLNVVWQQDLPLTDLPPQTD
jgi:hypothetical protein